MALLASALTVLAQASAQAQIAWAPCGDSNDFACGHLTVALDPAGGPETITLAMRRHLAPMGQAKDAVIALAGGPGQAAIPLTERFSRLLGPVMDTRDLIVFDQRGIGLSHPLSCAAFEHLRGRPATPRAIGICAGQIGSARGLFTTADTVADIEAIRRAGGYEKLVLYGTSYGTKVAERYAQTFPSHVEALVLDSVLGPNGPDPLKRDTFAAIPLVLRGLCADRACLHASADPVADLARLVRRLGPGSLQGRALDEEGRAHELSISSNDLLGVLYEGDFNPFLRAEFPAAVHSALNGDTAALARMVARAQGEEDEEEPESIGEGFDAPLYFATTCEEQRFPWSRTASPRQRIREAVVQARALPTATFAPFTAANAIAEGLLSCAYWPFASAGPERDEAPLPAVPTLIFSGQYDIRTPTSQARALAASIPDAHLVVVPHTGHSVISSALNECPDEALQAFFSGRPLRPCTGGGTPPYPAVDPVAPTRLARVPVAHGTGGAAGRALQAVVLTIEDFDRQSTLRFASRLAGRTAGTALLETRLGGLRGGWGALANGRISLHRYTYVPRIAVSGALSPHGGVLRIAGRESGRLALNAHLTLAGTLGGRRVSVTVPTLLR